MTEKRQTKTIMVAPETLIHFVEQGIVAVPDTIKMGVVGAELNVFTGTRDNILAQHPSTQYIIAPTSVLAPTWIPCFHSKHYTALANTNTMRVNMNVRSEASCSVAVR
jgi:hypothetical protein